MLMPKKVKHRKWHRMNPVGKATRATEVSFGSFGLKSMEKNWITARQIEAARRAITRHIKRGGKIWIRIFPDAPVTNKGSQGTMGTGKGSVDHYIAAIKPGTMLFEIDGVTEALARESLNLASHKLPVKTKFVVKQ